MNTLKIMSVDDESVVALDLINIIEAFGAEPVGMAHNSWQAVALAKEKKPDLILMDINLGDEKDGIDTVKEIRKFLDVYVIYITAYSDEETIERAVATDPIGYLVKPFNKREIYAGIRIASYKKSEKTYEQTSKTHIKDEFFYDEKLEQLYNLEEPIILSKKEQLLFKLLLNSRGKYVSLKAIEAEVWQGDYVSDNNRRNLIYRLKSKLNHKIIECKFGVGCKIDK